MQYVRKIKHYYGCVSFSIRFYLFACAFSVCTGWVRTMNGTTLADLAPGESGIVAGIDGRGMLGQRLVDMGLYPGVEAKVVRRAPLGDPIEVDAEGALVNLRREEARFVRVKKL